MLRADKFVDAGLFSHAFRKTCPINYGDSDFSDGLYLKIRLFTKLINFVLKVKVLLYSLLFLITLA
jgi:hypothetical protein